MNTQTMQGMGGAVAAVVLMSMPAGAFAWEQDVHYGLTRYLAEQAETYAAEADVIASADQAVDDNNETAATWLMIWKVVPGRLIYGNDRRAIQASELIQLHHFPSTGSIPAPPAERMVVTNASEPRQRIRDALQSGDFDAAGKALHALQDSWSHQGCSDTPIRPLWRLRESFSWSHPKRRGGWSNHNADLTSWQRNTPRGNNECDHTPTNNIDVTLEMARETFLILGGNESNWSSIEDEVRSFAEANTIEAKLDWFNTEFPGDDNFNFRYIRKINLPRHANWQERLPTAGRVDNDAEWPGFALIAPALAQNGEALRFACNPSAETTPSEPLKAFADWFLNTWLTDGATTTLVENAVDLQQIAASLAAFEDQRPPPSEWVGKFLTLWLINDHGAVNALGHGMPGPGYESLPVNIDEAAEFGLPVRNYESLTDALVFIAEEDDNTQRSFVSENHRYGIVPGPAIESRQDAEDTVFFIDLRFKDYSHDSLGLVVACQPAGTGHAWKVVRFVWEAM